MCGIVGIWAKYYGRDQLRGDLENAVTSLHHRGPDDRGIWINDSGVGLGHTRLSILDLSYLGHQPMISADERHVLVYNGEIYNFTEIRDRLVSAGHTFCGSGDTEVILHAFKEWGPTAVNKFIGMFAIALWDEKAKTLELYRDRVGVKPLYFGWHNGSFCFASELKALLAFGHWVPEIDRQSLGEFFQYGYVPDNRSIYKGVQKLLPGHRLRLSSGQLPIVEPYWSVLDALDEPFKGKDQDIEEELEALLVDACRYRMVSDVPVGVYLSGGIDSSLVAAILAKHHDQTIQTFTIGFTDKSRDESVWARNVAEHCGTEHTEYILEPREALEIARDWGNLFDEPFADSSGIPTLLVSRLASSKVKVVLSADGGDELFSGYNSYTTVLAKLDRLARIPNWIKHSSRAGLDVLASKFPDPLCSGSSGPDSKRDAIARKIHELREILKNSTPGGLIDNVMSRWYPDQIRRLLGRYDRPESSTVSYPGDATIQISLRDFHHYLPGDILTKVDRTTMAVSIEGREPLLDHRLAEFAFRIPQHLRQGALGPKHILKSILYRHVPRPLIERPKRGFGIPKIDWLEGDLRGLVDDFLSPERVRKAGVMDPWLVSRVVRDFYAGNRHMAEYVWQLLTFEMWRERWGRAN